MIGFVPDNSDMLQVSRESSAALAATCRHEDGTGHDTASPHTTRGPVSRSCLSGGAVDAATWTRRRRPGPRSVFRCLDSVVHDFGLEG